MEVRIVSERNWDSRSAHSCQTLTMRPRAVSRSPLPIRSARTWNLGSVRARTSTLMRAMMVASLPLSWVKLIEHGWGADKVAVATSPVNRLQLVRVQLESQQSNELIEGDPFGVPLHPFRSQGTLPGEAQQMDPKHPQAHHAAAEMAPDFGQGDMILCVPAALAVVAIGPTIAKDLG